MSEDLDLLLCLFPFEPGWYARRVPRLRVEFVGHPLVDRCRATLAARGRRPADQAILPKETRMLLLPGSRPDELRRHLPVMLEAARQLRRGRRLIVEMVLPEQRLADIAAAIVRERDSGAARSLGGPDLRQTPPCSESDGSSPPAIRVGQPGEALARADVAIASTGTVTLECALFGVPTVTFYKTSWLTYQIGRRLITVDYLSMPNLLLRERVFPEFIQSEATGENLAQAALQLLADEAKRTGTQRKLAEAAALLGEGGASQRAAEAIASLL
jgi:lipid-A-disaccharide synthase